jgi:hypothetical protein
MKETNKKITTCSFLFVDHIILRPRNFFFFFLESSFMPSGSKCPDNQEEEWKRWSDATQTRKYYIF